MCIRDSAFANNKFLKVDSSNGVFTNSLVWGAEPTTTVTQIVTNGAGGAANLTSSGTYVMYSWAEIPGYSKFGHYTGNGSSDGTFINCGFKPSFVLAKRTDSTGYWRLLDSKRDPDNPAHHVLFPNTSDAVSDTDGSDQYNTDFLANGFKIRTTLASSNTSGGKWIFMAFAEQIGNSPYGTETNAR